MHGSVGGGGSEVLGGFPKVRCANISTNKYRLHIAIIFVAKEKKRYGPKSEPNGQFTVKILLYGGKW